MQLLGCEHLSAAEELPHTCLQAKPMFLEDNKSYFGQVSRLRAMQVSPSALLTLAAGVIGCSQCGSPLSNLWTDLDGSLLGAPGQVGTSTGKQTFLSLLSMLLVRLASKHLLP